MPTTTIVRVIEDLLVELQLGQKDIHFCKILSHVGIVGNGAADKAANEVVNLPGLHITRIPHQDLYSLIRRYILTEWQN